MKPPYCDVLPVQTMDYYERALQHFLLDATEFFIFSDDIAWCKQQRLFQDLPKKVFVEETNEIKSLAMMSTCLGGMICANSSFSWWGAFLGAHKERAVVIVPKDWFRGGVGHLFPSEWIIL